MVKGWPKNFSPLKASQLGFKSENKNFNEIIKVFIEDLRS